MKKEKPQLELGLEFEKVTVEDVVASVKPVGSILDDSVTLETLFSYDIRHNPEVKAPDEWKDIIRKLNVTQRSLLTRVVGDAYRALDPTIYVYKPVRMDHKPTLKDLRGLSAEGLFEIGNTNGVFGMSLRKSEAVIEIFRKEKQTEAGL